MGFTNPEVAGELIVFECNFNYTDKYSIAGTWAVHGGAAAWIYNAYANQATKALNDELALTGFLIPEEAVYTLHIIHHKDTDCGIMHFFINGVDVAQIDCYAGAPNSNAVSSITLGTLTAGAKILRIKMASKNASSSAYKTAVQYMAVVRA